jgi:molecular chaperone GrpE (heat shock protein)
MLKTLAQTKNKVEYFFSEHEIAFYEKNKKTYNPNRHKAATEENQDHKAPFP